ncbi:hypothetical protein BDF14DRAFT_1752622 [Spinellus fusiger]|nr:hypothetical protein BDF14DRAFT_1752622 [Spinellus fusiger]
MFFSWSHFSLLLYYFLTVSCLLRKGFGDVKILDFREYTKLLLPKRCYRRRVHNTVLMSTIKSTVAVKDSCVLLVFYWCSIPLHLFSLKEIMGYKDREGEIINCRRKTGKTGRRI